MSAQEMITEHLDLWTGAVKHKSGTGRGNHGKIELTGIKKLRELILELAVRGKLVQQDPSDEPASALLDRIAEEKARLVKEGKIKKPRKLPEISEEEKPFELPETWSWIRLGNISQINPRNDAEDDLQASFIPMPLISTSYNGEHDQEPRPWREMKKGYTHFADGDIAIAKITPCFENSKAAIFSSLKNGIGAGTTELHVARPFGNTLNPRYVLLCLKSPRFLSNGERKMTGSAGQKRVPKDFFAGEPLPFAPLPEQHRIVKKVDELMTLCDRLEQQVGNQLEAHEVLVDTLLDALTRSSDATELAENWARVAEHFDTLFTTEASIEKLKQTILQLAVMGRLVPQSLNDKHASALLDEILAERDRLKREEGMKTKASGAVNTEEAYLTIPRSWVWVRLGNTAKFIDYRGKTPKKVGGGKRLITAKNIRKGYIDKDPEEFISEPDYHTWMTRGFPRVGDTLFTPEAPLGNAANVDLEEEFALAQRAICFQWHVREISPFMLMQILAFPFQEQLIFNATGMTATGIKAAKLKEIPVVLPPLEEQKSIVEKVEELMALCDRLKVRLGEAGETRAQLAETVVEQAVN